MGFSWGGHGVSVIRWDMEWTNGYDEYPMSTNVYEFPQIH